PAYNRGESELERDAERVLAMQLEGGDGPAWDDIRSDCWGYAWRVLPEMLDDGRLWVRYRELGGMGDLGAVRLDLERRRSPTWSMTQAVGVYRCFALSCWLDDGRQPAAPPSGPGSSTSAFFAFRRHGVRPSASGWQHP